jgi:hypothetical protein
MNDCLAQYYRCPQRLIRFAPKGPLCAKSGYFQLGNQTTCYGGYYGHEVAESPVGILRDALRDIEVKNGNVYLPFDPSQVADSLRGETYAGDWRQSEPVPTLARIYYFLRPALPVVARRRLQELYFRNWGKLPFPRWPVDCSVDDLLARLLLLSVQSNDGKRVPFIWFWPQGATACSIMTHDVETQSGRDFCPTLMDIDDLFGIKASFQIIPEQRYRVCSEFLASIRERGFEVVVHDLNHDGRLYGNRQRFLERAAKINAYGKEFQAEGLRAGGLYRKQLWYDALEFSYDMSVPSVAHLDPQRGGCCTVMPYFIGRILELPVTTTQDYTLFHILKDDSIDLWKHQIELIMRKYGLISFIVHPDYILRSRQQSVYKELLSYLIHLREDRDVWVTIPGEVNRWWRQRAEMNLVEDGEGWRIEGPGKERACVAYANEEDGCLVLTFQAKADATRDSLLHKPAMTLR